jgi:hypothetical protein
MLPNFNLRERNDREARLTEKNASQNKEIIAVKKQYVAK